MWICGLGSGLGLGFVYAKRTRTRRSRFSAKFKMGHMLRDDMLLSSLKCLFSFLVLPFISFLIDMTRATFYHSSVSLVILLVRIGFPVRS